MNSLTENIKDIQQLNKELKKAQKQLINNLEKMEIKNSEINKYKEQFLIDLKQNEIDFPDIYIPEITMTINNIKNLDINHPVDINKLTKQNKKVHINPNNNIIQIYYPPKYGNSNILIIRLTTKNIIEKITFQKIRI